MDADNIEGFDTEENMGGSSLSTIATVDNLRDKIV
jgi:hypothetical protein